MSDSRRKEWRGLLQKREEKKIYDNLLRVWDCFRKGFVGGDTAIEIMG